jgi:hypothetical protein
MARARHRKKSTRVGESTRAIVVRPTVQAARPIVIRQGKAAKRGRRRGGGGGGNKVGGITDKHRLGAMAGAALLGFLDKSETIHVPTLPYLGKAGTAGVALWAAGKFLKSAWADNAATGALCIAVYELTKEGKVSGEDVDGYVAGGYVAGGL